MKAVSPLIAAILLIAFTVSIGVMIIGWGKQYVQQQTGCLGMEVTILSVDYDPNTNTITSLTAINTGSVAISSGSKLYLVIEDRDGKRKTELLSTLGGDWKVGEKQDFTPLSIQPPSKNKPFKIWIVHGRCKEISDVYMIS